MNQAERDEMLSSIARAVGPIPDRLTTLEVEVGKVGESLKSAHKRLDGLDDLPQRVTAVETRCDDRMNSRTAKLASWAAVRASWIKGVLGVVGVLGALILGWALG